MWGACGKPLEKELRLGAGVMKDELCPHVCVLQCHPGPCPPCKAFAPPRLCPCGKKVITTRCSDRKSVLTCGQRCDKLLDCGCHRCERICHVGACDPCQVLINAPCFCKERVEVVICGDMAIKGKVKAEDGIFSCGSTCGKKLRCGNHNCAEICHPGPYGIRYVPSSFVVKCTNVTKCVMLGIVHLVQFLSPKNAVVDQLLGGCNATKQHLRMRDSHVTNLAGIRTVVDIDFHRLVVIHLLIAAILGIVYLVLCLWQRSALEDMLFLGTFLVDQKISDATSSAARPGSVGCMHVGERVTQRHVIPLLELNEVLGLVGKHVVPFGETSGTHLPFWGCLPCSVLVAEECIGGHVVLRNIPCGSKDIRCNKLCGKTRQCGLHACGRTCHPTPCDTSSGAERGFRTSCGQTCGALWRDFRHTCTASCRPSAPCPDVRCDFRVTITCSCGRITATVLCNAGGCNSGFNVDTVFEASIIQKLPLPLQLVELTGKKIPLRQRKLMCDDECAGMQMGYWVIADAFDITYPNLDALHFGENSVTSELLSDLYRRDPKWVLAIEDRCKCLVLGKNRGTTTGLKVHVFCPMLKDRRDAVRVIAERWKLAISAAGWEPKRFIVVHVTSKSKPPPRIIGVKGSTNLPRKADISALVLRFGGECELVWLNDENALAVFSDPARAAMAMRRLDHGSVYNGAVIFIQSGGASGASSANNAWGGTGPSSALKANPWKKAVVQELGWREDSWAGEESFGGTSDLGSVWKGKEAPIVALINRWTVLDSEKVSNSAGLSGGGFSETEPLEVVDDWEKAMDKREKRAIYL
ncbi:hypothetical protein CRYUN_Cryun13aG0064900 [Craigia yunnanensis]